MKARPGLVADGAEDFLPRLLALRGKPGESITFLRSAEGGKLEKLKFTVKGAKTVKIKAGEFTGIEVAKKILDAGKDTKVKSESWVFSSEGRMLFSKAGDEPFWLEKGTGTGTKTAGPAKASEAVGTVIKYITAMTKKDRNALKGLLDMDALFEFFKNTGAGKREMQKMDAKQMKQFRGLFPLIVLRRLTDHKPGENEELGLAILTDPSVWEEEESGGGEKTVRLIKPMRDADPILAAISFRVKPVGGKWLITHMPGMESKLAATAT